MVSPANMKYGKGWFLGVGRDGDRTLEQQMTGLDQLLSEAPGKTVIDAGCAEGLITIAMAKAGAKSCLGLEVVPSHIVIARDLAAGLPCKFVVADLNSADLDGIARADIVLLLAILHKMKDPSKVCAVFADLTLDLCVVRLPPSGPTILDHRSEFVPHDIVAVMATRGLGLESVVDGPFGEWTGYFRRPGVVKTKPPKHAEHYDNTAHFPSEPRYPNEASETVAPNAEPVVSSTVTIGPEDETPKSNTETAAPTPPSPADELKVDPVDAPAKIEGGQPLFPTIGRRGRRSEAKVQADEPKTDETK